MRLKKLIGFLCVAYAVIVGGGHPAFASCPGYTLQHICPAGGFEYEAFYPPSACHEVSPPSIGLPSFLSSGRRDIRRELRCEGNNFPNYRSFTREEGAVLDVLVDTSEYLERMDWPYGALSIWIEEHLTGNVPPGWAAQQTILDLYRRRAATDSKRNAAFAAGLPNLITGARTSKKVGRARAKEAADIAYLLQLDGRIHEARAWLRVSFQELDRPPEEETPGLIEETPRLTTTREIVESVSVCLESDPQQRVTLCRSGGVYQFAHMAIGCLQTQKASFCDALDGWPKQADALAAAIQNKRIADPVFKKLFDRRATFRFPAPPLIQIRLNNHNGWCVNRDTLGLTCIPGPVSQAKKFDLAVYFPDLVAARPISPY